ncbi:transposon ty3-i Gag-Pol polyprotein [Plakobranchus ocellatus]|uniref:Transposon ty3-i Gag-Pol polyprotein n=1 Tax=Plakobranchus ocellatus TaxID=259542 RepID=A0AAV4CSV4_9GAST|nr:transposon ty3-i Gag-Pol polyprotein [Plakobranchus ocellatus]
MISHEIPNRPWAKLGADIFHFGGHDYLLVVDYFSKYPEIARLKTKTATGVKTVLRPIFARHGIPDKLIADNMPFNSYEMKQFAKEWNFTITTSSPTYAQSNGQSERYIQTVKNLIRKAVEENNDPNLALLSYRNIPIYGLEKSPAQLLFGRRLQDQVPTATKLLKPPYASVKQKVQARQEKQKFYYDSSTRHHKNFQLDDNLLAYFSQRTSGVTKITVNSLRSGSLIIDFTTVFNMETTNNAGDQMADALQALAIDGITINEAISPVKILIGNISGTLSGTDIVRHVPPLKSIYS